MILIDSVCPKCGEINHIDSKGKEISHVKCQCKHEYEHVLVHYSRFMAIDEKRAKVEDMIVEKKFHKMSDKSVICLLIFENGYEVAGRSTVRDVNDFRLVIGQDKAYEQALRKSMVALGAFLV